MSTYLLWLALAIAFLVGSIVSDTPAGIGYWFAIGASMFFLGIHSVVQAIEKAAKK